VRGPFKIDLARDRRTGRLFTLEVNARFTLWNHLGAAAGVNLPAVAYHWLAERRAPAERALAAPGPRWVSLGRDARGVRDDPGARLLAWARWARSLMAGPLVHEVFDWRDPGPTLALAGQHARGALRSMLG
jgi:D-aspartate ligase